MEGYEFHIGIPKITKILEICKFGRRVPIKGNTVKCIFEGNVELNWPKLFQAFFVKVTLMF